MVEVCRILEPSTNDPSKHVRILIPDACNVIGQLVELAVADRIGLIRLTIGQQWLVELGESYPAAILERVRGKIQECGFVVKRAKTSDGQMLRLALTPDILMFIEKRERLYLSPFEAAIVFGRPSSAAMANEGTLEMHLPSGPPHSPAEFYLTSMGSSAFYTKELTWAMAQWAEIEAACPLVAEEGRREYETFRNRQHP